MIQVAIKELREAFRQRRNLAITLGLPLAFMAIFGLAFGSESQPTYEVAIFNQDSSDLGDAYVEGMDLIRYDDDRPLVRAILVDDWDAATAGLEDRTYDLAVAIPRNFSRDLTPQENPGVLPLPGEPSPPHGTTIALAGDPTQPSFTIVAPIVGRYSQDFVAQVTGQEPLLDIRTEAVTAATLTGFDFIAPGLMIFAILSLVPQVTGSLAQEVESGTINRVRLSPLRPVSLLAGVSASHLVLAAFSLALMLLMADLMGFHNQGTYLAAYGISLIAAFSVIGVGLFIAAFSGNQQEAANLGVLFSVPASFLSGAFFRVPGIDLFSLPGGRIIGLYDLLPTTHAVVAMRRVLTFGQSIEEVRFELAAMTVLALLWFLVGVWTFSRRRLRPT